MAFPRFKWLFVVLVALLMAPTPLISGPATPASDETQLYIGHHTRLTARIPADWSVVPRFSVGYGDATGLFSSTTYLSDTLGAACQQSATELAGDGDYTITETRWRGTPACRIDVPSPLSWEGPLTSMVLTHPEPFTYAGQRITYIAILVTPEHLDAILPSLSFDLSGLTGPQIAHSILDLAEANAYVRDSVDWAALRAAADEIVTPGDVPRFLQRTLLPALGQSGDTHSFLLPPIESQAMNPYAQGPPSGEMRGALGYIQLPPVLGNAAAHDYVGGGYAVIEELEPQACGWIIDLRDNVGGNPSLMIQTLLPFFEQGRLIGMVDAYGNEAWLSREDSGIRYDREAFTVPFSAELDIVMPDLTHPDAPIAVLVGPRTMSAAEWTLVALGGREQTRSFGQPTAGFTTGQVTFAMLDGSTLMLASFAAIDTDGNVHTGKVQPDEWVTSQSRGGDAQGMDGTIVAAEKWLLEQPGCQAATPAP